MVKVLEQSKRFVTVRLSRELLSGILNLKDKIDTRFKYDFAEKDEIKVLDKKYKKSDIFSAKDLTIKYKN